MTQDQTGSSCNECGTAWLTSKVPPKDARPARCVQCGATDVAPFDHFAEPFLHHPNPEMQLLQYLTPGPPPLPDAVIRMGPYMPLTQQNTPDARWAEDPTGRNQWRWWTGRAWTEHVANDGVVRADPLP